MTDQIIPILVGWVVLSIPAGLVAGRILRFCAGEEVER